MTVYRGMGLIRSPSPRIERLFPATMTASSRERGPMTPGATRGRPSVSGPGPATEYREGCAMNNFAPPPRLLRATK